MFQNRYTTIGVFKRTNYWICLSFWLLLNTTNLYAQDVPSKLSISLQKARQIAIAEHTTVLSKTVDVLIAKEAVKQAKKESFPEVYTDFNLQRNIIIPSTPVPAIAFSPNAPEGELLLLKFSTKWTGNAGVNVNYDLFNPEQKSNLRQSKIKITLAETDKELSILDVVLNISNAYVAALIAQEQLNLNQADVLTKTEIHTMLSEQFDEGRITLIEFNKGKVALNTALSKHKEAENIVAKANAELLYEMGYNPLHSFQLAFEDTIETLFESYRSPSQTNDRSLNLQKFEQEKQLLDEEMLAAKMKYYPKLSLGAYYGNNFFDNNFDVFKQTNWHGNSYVNIGLRIPLTDWMRLKNEKAVINYQMNNKALAYKNQENQSALNYFKALKDIEFNETKYEDLKKNFLWEQESFRLTQEQFAEGRLLIEELSKADYAVQLAKNEYLNIAYDFLIAKIKLEYENSK